MLERQFDAQEPAEHINMKDYLRILYRGRLIIFLAFVLVLSITAYFTFTTKPVFRATAKVLVERRGSMERALFNMNYFNNQSTLLTNQVEILKSRTLTEQVVLYLEAKPYRDSLSIFQSNSNGDYLSLREQIDWIQGHMAVDPKTDADVIEITFHGGSPFEAAEVCNVVAETFQQLNKNLSRSEFRELRQFLEFQLKKKGEELRKSEEMLRGFQEQKKLVSLDESTRELISRLAESQAQLEATTVSLESSQEQRRNLERQLDGKRLSLASEVTNISSPVLLELQKEYARMVNEKVKYETLLAEDKTIDPKEYQTQLRNMNSRIRAVQSRLQQEARRIAGSTMVSDPLQIAQELIGSILEIETRIKGFRAKIEALREVVDQYESELERLPGQRLDLARLERKVRVDQNTYILLTEKLEETKISEAGQRESIRVVDRAIEPHYPVSPKTKLNLLLGAIIGLALGVGITLLIEYFDDSIKNPDELERMGLSILSIIPEISQEEVTKKYMAKSGTAANNGSVQHEARLITHFDPKSPISESYRTLRTNIQFKSMQNNQASTILVTSSTPKEGKSTTIANLAITMAQMGSKTLIVDTDLRRPVVHSIFGLKKDKGITNFLMRRLDFEDIVKTTLVDNLFAITSGPLPPNPSELLASPAMNDFIEVAKEHFDLIFFDAPPVIAVTDAAILSTKVDGGFIVIRAHQTQKSAIQRAKSLLDNVNANIHGCVLNGVNVERAYSSSYYYYYYHYYSYYGSDKKRKKKSKSKTKSKTNVNENIKVG